jgi:type I restriction enzyme R subunit
MLSTGVDIPDLEYIVFLRPVKSRILFVQMMGRGTRKGEHYPDKSHFVVFDCFDGTLLEYFKQATDITAEAPERETRTIVQVIDDIWQNRDRNYNIRCLVKRLQRIAKDMSGEAREMFSQYIPDGDMGKYAKELPHSLQEDFTGAMSIFRNPDFQELLTDYPRKLRTFVVAYETEDVITSSWLIRDGKGNEYKPEDYLQIFSRFIRENEDRIEAIRILLERPKYWSTDALSELRKKLAATPERYTLENLQKAHELHYHKALVDIISMVKHAVREQEPLLTSEERVNRALAKVTHGKTFTKEQQNWLDRIRDHMIQNLSINKEDFDTIPIFTRDGGWGKANKVFKNQLEELLKEFNEAVAV